MKNKIFLLSSIISSCILTIACNQSTADELHPKMPKPQQRCYPASKCVGDPNLIGGNGSRGNGNKSNNYGYSYNYGDSNGSAGKALQTESTQKLVGVIKSVDRVALPNETQIQLTLSTDQGDVLVIVGPARFFDQSRIKVKAGDKVIIKGYRITANGREVFMAAEIDKNGNTLKLLNENRMPAWGNNQGYNSRY